MITFSYILVENCLLCFMKVLEKKVREMMQRKSINLKMHLRNNKKKKQRRVEGYKARERNSNI